MPTELTDVLIAKARAHRERLVKQLQACTCGHPLIVYRSMHGHDQKCPAADLWREFNLHSTKET